MFITLIVNLAIMFGFVYFASVGLKATITHATHKPKKPKAKPQAKTESPPEQTVPTCAPVDGGVIYDVRRKPRQPLLTSNKRRRGFFLRRNKR